MVWKLKLTKNIVGEIKSGWISPAPDLVLK